MVPGCELAWREATGERGLNQLPWQLPRHDEHTIITFQRTGQKSALEQEK